MAIFHVKTGELVPNTSRKSIMLQLLTAWYRYTKTSIYCESRHLHYLLVNNEFSMTEIKVQQFSSMRDWRSTPLEWLSITRDPDLDLGSGHMAYGRASVIDLYLHTKFHWNWKNFFVDGLTAGTAPSSRSCDTKTRTNIENPTRSNLDIVL